MYTHFSRRLMALLLCALLFIGVCALPRAALAGALPAANWWEFITDTRCAQFTVGVHSNSFPHSKAAFPTTYVISKQAYADLLSRCRNDRERQSLIQSAQRPWGGSCYGISMTMALACLTEKGKLKSGLPAFRASDMARGAAHYFDIGYPVNNPAALERINYYMLSQALSASKQGAVWTARSALKNGRVYWSSSELSTVARAVRSFVDSGRPFQLGYGYTKKDGTSGGHAIVGVDYYIDRTADAFYIKCYDENDRSSETRYGTIPHFYYIKLKIKSHSADYSTLTIEPMNTRANANDRVCLYGYDHAYWYKTGKQRFIAAKLLNRIQIRNVEKMYSNLLAPAASRAALAEDAAGYADAQAGTSKQTLTLDEVTSLSTAFRIKPFAYVGGDVNTVEYADDCGKFYQPDDAQDEPAPDYPPDEPAAALPPTEADEQDVYAPVPVNENDPGTPFSNMTGYDYVNSLAEEDQLEEGQSMELYLTDSGLIQGAQRTFDGCDLLVSGDLPGASVLSADHYAWVSGNDIELMRVSSDGRLRDVNAGAGGGSDLALYFGTTEELNGALNMFRFHMNSFGFLQVYDTEDNEAYSDCVVLRTDGLPDGFDFTFYKDALISDDYEGTLELDDADVIWIKIQAVSDPSEQTGLGVKVWAEGDIIESDGFMPTFDGTPVYYPLHERAETLDVSTTVPALGDEARNSYSFKGNAKGEPLPDGSLRFTIDASFEKQTGVLADGIPLQKGVDHEVEMGSTIVTLKPAFLKTLKDGSHTLTVYFTDGAATTEFTTPLTAALTAVPDVPATGEAPLLYRLLRLLRAPGGK